MPPGHVRTRFNAYVRAIYSYGLAVVGVYNVVEEEDQKWEQIIFKTFLKTKKQVVGERKSEDGGAVPGGKAGVDGVQNGRQDHTEVGDADRRRW